VVFNVSTSRMLNFFMGFSPFEQVAEKASPPLETAGVAAYATRAINNISVTV
jgi:hypothetical protein